MLRTQLSKGRIFKGKRTPLSFTITPQPILNHNFYLRAFSTPLTTRPPTFTTPAPSPTFTIENYDPSKPLPPTDLPVEDYASPLLHTANIFSNLFRYAVLGSVSIVLVGLTGLVGVHYWVEHVELASHSSTGKVGSEDEAKWNEEVEGWSGAYLGGGTDPRLGTFARSAIRGAWISQHWGGGAIASPISTSNPSASPFSVGGGTMIGASTGEENKEVGDAGWQMAEQYLIYALRKAGDKGISLVFAEGEKGEGGMKGESADRAAVELEERLAGLREKIGGRYKLEQAREGWERIYYSVGANSNPTQWEKRERIKATKKLGDISVRLSSYWREGSQEKELEKAKAIGWFLGGLLPSLASRNKDGLSDDTPGISNSKKSVSPSSSFFGYWSRSHPPTTTGSLIPVNKSEIKPELITLIHLLDHRDLSATFDLATSRLLLNSLVSLETFLARDRNLLAAQAVQRASLEFAQTLSHHNFPDGTPLSPSIPTFNPKKISTSLHDLFLATRTSLFSTHLAEVSLALGGRKESEALLLFQGALADCEKVILLLQDSSLIIPVPTLSKLRSSPSASDESSQKLYGKTARGILRDARLTGSMAARLSAYVHETGCGGLASLKKRKEKKEWCGGDTMAEEFYSKAMKMALVLKENGGDERLFKDAETGFERARKRVLAAEKARV